MLLGMGKKTEQAANENPSDVNGDVIFDVSAANFENAVLRASMQKPVIVDFWAPWCGPCKQLGPVLETEVTKAGGAVLMAKVNLDTNPELAQALRIQSVPTVYAFFQGQPVDAFMGAQPESKIKEFVGNLLKLASQGQPETLDIDSALKAAADALAREDFPRAIELYAAVFSEDQENASAVAGLVRTFIAAGQIDQAASVLEQAPENVKASPLYAEAQTALELALQKPAGDASDLEKRLAGNPADHDARFDLALLHYAQGRKNEAADSLLEILRLDREWQDGKAKEQLLKFFEAWGASDPATLSARRKLSSILFS